MNDNWNPQLRRRVSLYGLCYKGLVWQVCSNTHFHILNNITHIFIYFFTHTYIKNTQTTLLKLLYTFVHAHSTVYMPKFTVQVWWKKKERERETCEAQNALPKCSLYVTLLLLLACVSQIRWVGQVIGVSNYLVWKVFFLIKKKKKSIVPSKR